MCYSVKSKSTIAELQKRYDAVFEQNMETLHEHEMVSGFAHPKLPVITSEDPGKIHTMEWGLVPGWVKDTESAARMQNATLNARSETLFEKPSFSSIMKRRCLILIDGFYEWQQVAKEKIPYFIHLKSMSNFALGGLYDEWVNNITGRVYRGFSIITVPANPLMAVIHNAKKRMPLILPREMEKEWVQNDINEMHIKSLITQYPESDMQADPIKAKNDTPTLWD